MFLLGTIVFAFPGYSETKQISIKLQAHFCVADNDCGVIDAQEQLRGRLMPFQLTFLRRELQNLQRVSVRILEVKGANSGCCLEVVGQKLGAGRDLTNLILAKPVIGAIHVACDDGDMLKPAIVAEGNGGSQAPPGCQVFFQLDLFRSKLEPSDSDAQTEHSLKMFPTIP